MIGAALAFALPRNRAFAPITPGATRLLNIVGGVGLVGIFVMFWHTNQYEPFLYRGGWCCWPSSPPWSSGSPSTPGRRCSRSSGWEPLRWVGERSYAIYLWHYPVIVLTTPVGVPTSVLRASLQIAVTFVLAALSWRYVEQPVRTGALGRQWVRTPPARLVVAPTAPDRTGRSWAWWRANAVVCAVGLFGLVDASAAKSGSQVTSIIPTAHHHPSPSSSVPGTTCPRGSPSPPRRPPLRPPAQGVTAIGDSVMVDAAPYLRQSLPGIDIDAQVGQQLYQVQDQIQQLKAQMDIGDRAIIELGTNGPYTAAQLESLLNSLGPMQKIVLVNTRVPQPWQQEVNSTIASVAQSYPNAVVVDWYNDSAAFPQYFYPDGVHLNPVGARYYASLLVQALQTPLPTAHRRPPSTTTTTRRAKA